MSDIPWVPPSVPVAAVRLVAAMEAFRAAPYQDGGGVWTIGYGTTRIAGEAVTVDTPAVSEFVAQSLLRADLRGAAEDVARQIAVPQMECQAAALISWAYNLGGANLARSTLRSVINRGMPQSVPDEMRKWIYLAN